MSDGITVDTGAADQVAAGLEAAARRLGDPTGLVADIAAQVATDAGARTPRKTGALAGSMSVAGGIVEGRPAATLTWGVRYAAYVNFGTSRMPARPFATDALTTAAATAEPVMRTWAETAIHI